VSILPVASRASIGVFGPIVACPILWVVADRTRGLESVGSCLVVPIGFAGFSPAQRHHLLDAGFRIPEQLGFASLHIHHRREGPPTECAGLYQRVPEIAEQSLLLLDQLIRYNLRGFPEVPRHTLIPSVWQDGPTVRKR